MATNLAGRIRSARVRAGLSQAVLAERADVTDETISRVERGTYEPAVTTLVAIADALGTSVDALVRGGGPPARRRPSTPLLNKLAALAGRLPSPSQAALVRVAELLLEGSKSPKPRRRRG